MNYRKQFYKIATLLSFFCLIISQTFASTIDGFENVAKSKKNKGSTRIWLKVNYDRALPGDTMFFYKLSPFYVVTAPHVNAFAATRNNNGDYQFSIDTKQSDGYFVLVLRLGNSKLKGKRDSLLTPDFLFEEGDSLSINIKKNTTARSAEDSFIRFNYNFSGRGSRKLELLQQADSLQRTIGDSGLPIFDENFNYQDPCIQKIKSAYSFMTSHRNEISPIAYESILADIVYQKASLRINLIMDFYTNSVKMLPQTDIKRFVSSFNNAITDTITSLPISKLGLLRSFQYLRYLEYKNRTKCYVEKNERRIPSVIFNQIIDGYNGELRDRLIISQLFRYQNAEELNQQIEVAERLVTTPYCLIELRKLLTRQKGSPVYDFHLPNEKGQIVKMKDFIGKVVVVDFWFTGCDWCTTFYKDVISKVEEKYSEDKRVLFVTISTDRDKDKWLNSIQSGRYTSNKAINLYTDGQGSAHPGIKHYTIFKFPSFMIINRQGNVELFNTEELRFSANKMIDKIATLIKR